VFEFTNEISWKKIPSPESSRVSRETEWLSMGQTSHVKLATLQQGCPCEADLSGALCCLLARDDPSILSSHRLSPPSQPGSSCTAGGCTISGHGCVQSQ
jgi:hypothetical protein